MKKINNINYSKFVKSINQDENGIYVISQWGQVLWIQRQETECKEFNIGDIIEYEDKIYLIKQKNVPGILMLSGNKEYIFKRIENSWQISISHESEEKRRAIRVSIRQNIPYQKALKMVKNPIQLCDVKSANKVGAKKKKKVGRVKALMIKYNLDSDIASDVIKYNDPIENALKRQKERDRERQLKKIDLLDSGRVVPGSYGTGKRR